MEIVPNNTMLQEPTTLCRRTIVAHIMVLSCLVWVFYGRTISYDYTTWDDVIYVTKNTVLDKPTSHNIRRIIIPGNPTGARDGMAREMLYIPVTYLSYLVETTLFGKSPGAMHCTNVLLHMLNVLLVYALSIRFIRKPWAACAAAAAFAIHPLQAEAVAWVMGRKDVLSTAFAFGAILSYQQFLDSKLKRWHKLSVLLYCLAVFAKPSVIVLPAVFVLLDYRQHGHALGGEWGNKIPFLVIMLLAYFLNQQMPKESAIAGPGFLFRLLTVPWLTWHWTLRFFMLAEPIPIYAWPDPSRAMLMAIQGLPLFAIFVGTLVVAWKKNWSWLWQGLLAFSIAFLPATSVVLSARRFYTADRYGYMPIAFLFMLAALGIRGNRPWQKVYGVLFSIWLVAAGLFAVPAITVWGDSCRVWNKVLDHSPNYTLARLNRANTLAERKHFDEALADFQLLLTQSPDDEDVYWNLAQLHMNQGHPRKAARVLENATLKIPDSLRLALRLANAYEAMGDLPKAITQYRLTLQADPTNDRAVAGMTRVVKAHDKEQLLKNPNDVKALINLGLIALQENDGPLAVTYLRRAASLDSPHRFKALCALARAYRLAGAEPNAQATLKKIRAMRPRDPQTIRLQNELQGRDIP